MATRARRKRRKCQMRMRALVGRRPIFGTVGREQPRRMSENAMMKRSIPFAIVIATVLNGSVVSSTDGSTAVRTTTRNEADGWRGVMMISSKVGTKIITASLTDSGTSRDFVSLLPMTIKLEDQAATEKIGYLPRKLCTVGAPAGTEPATGDVTYYTPWGTWRCYTRTFRNSSRPHPTREDRVRIGGSQGTRASDCNDRIDRLRRDRS